MSTAEPDTRRTPGLVPVAESRASVERAPARQVVPDAPALATVPTTTWPFARLLRSEVGLTFRRPRNLAILAVLGAVPILIGVVMRMIGSDGADGEAGGIIAQATGNSLFLAFAALMVLTPLLMPVAVSVVAGDAIAGEASAGTLRYLLAAPAGRTRLLAVKYANAVIFSLAVTSVVALTALVTGLLLFPAGPVTLLSGTTVSMAEGLLRTLVIVGYVTAGMAALAAIALAFSTMTEAPIGAIAATVVLVVVTQVLGVIPQLAPIEPYLLPGWWNGFDGALRDPIATGDLTQGLLVFGAYILVFGSIAWARFTSKDVTS